MLARTINTSWNQANKKTFGPGHIYQYQIRILHIKHFYPQLTDKNGNQMENLGSLTLAARAWLAWLRLVLLTLWLFQIGFDQDSSPLSDQEWEYDGKLFYGIAVLAQIARSIGG